MSERKLIREFLNRANLDVCLMCGKPNCNCMSNPLESYDVKIVSEPHDNNHHDLDPDRDGHITRDDLYDHFDSNNDNKVTTQDYVDHVNYHAQYPESLDHYNNIREKNYSAVPCKDSYDTCSSHLLGTPDDVSAILSPLMDKTGSTCQLSAAQSLLDVLQSLINCGVFG